MKIETKFAPGDIVRVSNEEKTFKVVGIYIDQNGYLYAVRSGEDCHYEPENQLELFY